ncbi:MAG: hypothetical protein M4579_003427 [Chaenotheca gracillima]|nr:MAG: hypothetical protein M4579_003427 [Chaenotheca gracillima]
MAISISNFGLSFVFYIDDITPNDVGGENCDCPLGYWLPPTRRDGQDRSDSNRLYRWYNGSVSEVSQMDPAFNTYRAGHLEQYSVASIYVQTQTDNILAIMTDVIENDVEPGWRWSRLGFSDRPTVSFLEAGQQDQLPAPGPAYLIPQLLPRVYQWRPEATTNTNTMAPPPKGLCGELPLLLALAACSAPPSWMRYVLTQCIQPGSWSRHTSDEGSGRTAERGMIVTVCFDPRYPEPVSTRPYLEELEKGTYGAFYAL